MMRAIAIANDPDIGRRQREAERWMLAVRRIEARYNAQTWYDPVWYAEALMAASDRAGLMVERLLP